MSPTRSAALLSHPNRWCRSSPKVRAWPIRQLARIRKGFPLYIFAGTEDPVNANGAWLKPLIERYAAAGASVSTHLYAGARHEVLNELNRTEVVEDLVRWLDTVLRERTFP